MDFSRRTLPGRVTPAPNSANRGVCMNEVLTATLKEVRMNGLADERVFCSHKGTPYRSFRSALEQAVRKAGLEDLHAMTRGTPR